MNSSSCKAVRGVGIGDRARGVREKERSVDVRCEENIVQHQQRAGQNRRGLDDVEQIRQRNEAPFRRFPLPLAAGAQASWSLPLRTRLENCGPSQQLT